MNTDHVYETTRPDRNHQLPGLVTEAIGLLGMVSPPVAVAVQAAALLPRLNITNMRQVENAVDPHHNIEHGMATAGHIAGDLARGAWEEAKHHPGQLLADVAIGAAIGVGTVVAPEIVIPATLIYTGLEAAAHARQITHAVQGYAHDTTVLADPGRHSRQERQAADHDLEGLGAFGAHVVAGMAGAGAGGFGAGALNLATGGARAGALSATVRAGARFLRQTTAARAASEAGMAAPLAAEIPAEMPLLPARPPVNPRTLREEALLQGEIKGRQPIVSKDGEEMTASHGTIGDTPVIVRTASLDGEIRTGEIPRIRVDHEQAIAQIHGEVFDNQLPVTVSRIVPGGKVELIQEHMGEPLDSMPEAGHLYDTDAQFRSQVDQAVASQMIYGAEVHGGNFVVSAARGPYNVANIDMDLNNVNLRGEPLNVPDKLKFDLGDPMRSRLIGDLSPAAVNKVEAFIKRFDNAGGRVDLRAAGLKDNEIDPMIERARWLASNRRYPTPADQPKPTR